MPNADTSQIEAVNTMLSLVGEDAVNSLDTNVTAEVALAIRTLEEVNRQLQVRGWNWNIEREVTITADGASQYPWQSDWIRVETDEGRYSDIKLERNGAFLFNVARRKATNVFTATTLKVDITRYRAWADIPESARQFMMIKASRIFTNRVLGDDSRAGYAKLDEDEAWKILLESESSQSHYNFMDRGAPRSAYRNGGDAVSLPTF